MKPKQDSEFSWKTLFIVTAICFLAFSAVVKIIDGSTNHSLLFLKVGAGALVLFLGSLISEAAARQPQKKKISQGAE